MTETTTPLAAAAMATAKVAGGFVAAYRRAAELAE